jgi:transposase-like protein
MKKFVENCPNCGSKNTYRQNGGERGEGASHLVCYDCEYTDEPIDPAKQSPAFRAALDAVAFKGNAPSTERVQ